MNKIINSTIFKTTLISFIIIMTLLFLVMTLNGQFNNYDSEEKYPYVLEVYRHNIELQYYNSKSALVDSIDVYIKEISPKSCMNSIAFVEISEQYNLDVFFMLAQCQNESSFGSAGLARKTNSAFGVKAYDKKGAKHMDTYEHPDLSINDYAELINSNYLTEGKTEYDLMVKFVDNSGKRYASDVNYENKIYSIYKRLDDRFGDTYKDFLKYKTLSGK